MFLCRSYERNYLLESKADLFFHVIVSSGGRLVSGHRLSFPKHGILEVEFYDKRFGFNHMRRLSHFRNSSGLTFCTDSNKIINLLISFEFASKELGLCLSPRD